MNLLTILGLFAVSAMLVCYALEQRSRWFILGFAGACALASIYGFLQGAWPFGLVEGVWTLVALQKWRRTARILHQTATAASECEAHGCYVSISRQAPK